MKKKNQKYPHKSKYALKKKKYLPDPNELLEGFTLNAIHHSVNCNSRMHLALAEKNLSITCQLFFPQIFVLTSAS